MDKEKQTQDAPEQSLYRIICGAIGDDGMLHSAFSLPRPRRIQEKITFADGAYDGISLYHMTPDRRDIRSLTEIVGLLSAGACEKADECLTLFFSTDEYITLLPMIDELQQWIVEHRAQINAAALYEGCVCLLKESRGAENVKFALGCLALLQTGGNPQVRNLVKVLALSDEFTLWCLPVMEQWDDGPAAVFDAARRVRGWGRIHAVERLRCDGEPVRRWLLLEGWHNTVMDEYSARTCAEKCALAERLKAGDLDEAEFDAAGALLPVLLREGPVAPLASLLDKDGLADRYLAAAERRRAKREALETISIELEKKGAEAAQLAARYRALLDKAEA